MENPKIYYISTSEAPDIIIEKIKESGYDIVIVHPEYDKELMEKITESAKIKLNELIEVTTYNDNKLNAVIRKDSDSIYMKKRKRIGE